MIDWKKVATERLHQIRMLEARNDRLRETVELELKRELGTVLHAYCVARSAYELKIDLMAKAVAERLYPK